MFALSHMDGKRPIFFELAGVPKGWVVDAKVHPRLLRKCKAEVIPLRIQGYNPIALFRAYWYWWGVKRRYGNQVIMLMVRSEDTMEGWFTRPVFKEDFAKIPSELLTEATTALNAKDFRLSEMKSCAYMAISGIAGMQ